MTRGLGRTAQSEVRPTYDHHLMERLSPTEDEQLRRLAALAEYGELTPEAQAVFQELRRRDRRTEIREPRVVAVPVQKGPRETAGWVSD